MLSEVYVGVGSNQGNRLANIVNAWLAVKNFSKAMTMSSVYETAPQHFLDQPRFLNAVCHFWTDLDPFQLMARLKEIETSLGRRRLFPNAPRTLDLDILIYGRSVFRTPTLSIPHPRMESRVFVLEPLVEIAPGLYHPFLKETVHSLLRRQCAPMVPSRKLGFSPPVWSLAL